MSDATTAQTRQAPALFIFRDEPLDGPDNMARDEHLLHSDAVRPAALRIYYWQTPTISLGYFQSIANLAALPPELRRLPIVRRLTGGGAILHDREVTYSLTLDDSVAIARRGPADLYRLVHECWRDAIAAAGGPRSELAPDDFPLPSPRSGPFFCFEKPGRTDLIIGSQKVLGSAQRRIPGRVMQHGSLVLDNRFAANPGTHLGNPDANTVHAWIDSFLTRLAEQLSLSLRESRWTADQIADIQARRARYAGSEWLQKR